MSFINPFFILHPFTIPDSLKCKSLWTWLDVLPFIILILNFRPLRPLESFTWVIWKKSPPWAFWIVIPIDGKNLSSPPNVEVPIKTD